MMVGKAIHLTLFFLSLLSFFIRDARSMPMLPACAPNVTKTPSVCCPIPAGYKTPCGFPTRGVCRPVQTYKEPFVNHKFGYQFKRDLRVHWPHRVFQYSCECLNRFWGQDCSECWFGYEGTNCQHRVVYTRKRANTMSSKDKKYFREVMTKAYDLPSRFVVPTGIPKNGHISGPFKKTNIIEYLVFMHWFASYEFQSKNHSLCTKTPDENCMNFADGEESTLFFHRLYLLMWEREMQRVARKYFGHGNWTVPYWDWTDSKKCDICTNDFVGSATGAYDAKSDANRLSPKSVFHNWQAYCSNFYKSECTNCYSSSKKVYVTRRWISNAFPTSTDVRTALSVPLYHSTSSLCHSFCHFLASGQNCFCDPKKFGLHSRIQQMLKGTMNRAESSPIEPLFLLHHANLDRLFARWNERVRPSKFEIPSYAYKNWLGNCRECAVVPVLPPVTNEDMMVDPIALGFDYEDLDFGSVKSTEKIASAFNTFVPPVERGCPKHKKSGLKSTRKGIIEKITEQLKDLLDRNR